MAVTDPEDTRPLNPNEVRLVTPIEKTGGETIKIVELRKPAPGEMRGLQLGQIAIGHVDQLSKLIPRISTPPLSEVDVAGMDLADFSSCYEKIASFLGN